LVIDEEVLGPKHPDTIRIRNNHFSLLKELRERRYERVEPAIPLVLAITGHRDLREEDLPTIENRLHGIFEDLRRKYPNTPVRLLSPLAEGADRVAARVALDEGAELVVPLPLPRDLYEEDFPDSRQEFEALLQKASAVFEIAIAPGNTVENIQEYGSHRDRQYQQVGAFIVRHCHILLALWDETDTDLTGGTAEIVRFKLEGLPGKHSPERKPLDPPQTGPVWHVLTRRRRTESDVLRADAPLQKLTPKHKKEDYYDDLYQHMDAFNRDGSTVTQKEFEQSGRGMPQKEDLLSDAERAILEVFVRADALSLRFQRKAYGSMRSIFWLAGVAVLIFATYDYMTTNWHVLLLYLLVYLVALTIFEWQNKHKFYERFLDYRALAEGLRVQLFWRLAGLADDVSDSYLRKQSDELQWIRESLRALNVVPPSGEPRFDLVEDHWIKGEQGQLSYFRRSAHRDKKRLETVGKGARVLYGSGFALTVVVTAVTAFTKLPFNLLGVLGILMGVVPAGVSLWLGWSEKMTLDEQAKQYARMTQVFHRANGLMEEIKQSRTAGPGTQNEMQNLFKDLGLEALIENGDWVLMHRERPVEIPK
jgi:hypothetical protein